MPDPPTVVIVGAGFGGLQCSRSLAGKPVRVILVDRHNYHLFTPLLYQVATSLLNPSDIAHPVRAVLRGADNVRFQLGEVTAFDLSGGLVRIEGQPSLSFDYLVIAVGSTTNFFGLSIEGGAFGLKDLPEALELRNHIVSCFEHASRESKRDARRRWLTVVIVGGGPTGIEYAGALSELVVRELGPDFPNLGVSEVRIVLVEALDRLLPAFSPRLGEYARRRLKRRAVEVRLGTRVVEAAENTIVLSSGDRLDAATLVWAAGVKARDLAAAPGVPLTASGRIRVDERLRIEGHPRAYAIGDIAAAIQEGGELPMLSAPAMQEARHVAADIVREIRGQPTRPFRYRDKGIMATIGRNAAVAEIGSLTLKGFPGWLAWLVVHLYFIIGFRNRLWVLAGWAWNYVVHGRPIRLITRARRRGTEADGEGGHSRGHS